MLKYGGKAESFQYYHTEMHYSITKMSTCIGLFKKSDKEQEVLKHIEKWICSSPNMKYRNKKTANKMIQICNLP